MHSFGTSAGPKKKICRKGRGSQLAGFSIIRQTTSHTLFGKSQEGRFLCQVHQLTQVREGLRRNDGRSNPFKERRPFLVQRRQQEVHGRGGK